MASDKDFIYLQRAAIRQQIHRSYATALQGVSAQTQGIMKLSESRTRKALGLDGVGGIDTGVVSTLRQQSKIGANHKEHVAILAVDMRGSTALAEEHEADRMFILIQCFIPLLAFIVRELNGEVIGLRGDGLIAAFGF